MIQHIKNLLIVVGFIVFPMLFFAFTEAPEEFVLTERPAQVYKLSHPPIVVEERNGQFSFTGTASWYSKRSPGIKKRTANNEIFSDKSMTCAIWGVPFNQKVKVTNLVNGKSVVLRVNDRGPHGRYFQKGRIIDLTKAAYKKLSDTKTGLIQVKVDFLRDV